MNSKEILTHLKRLNAIVPDGGFAARSRPLVTALPHEARRGFFLFPARFFAVGAFAAAFLALAGTALTIALRSAPNYSALSSANIQNELDSLDINIHLQEIELAVSVNKAIALAITEVSDTRPVRHLNKTLLETEQAKFSPDAGSGGEGVDELLRRVIF